MIISQEKLTDIQLSKLKQYKRAIIYNSLTAVMLNWDAAKTIFIIWAQAKNDLVNMCYNILATYCTNTPLIYSRPVTYIVANYVYYSSVMRTWFSVQHCNEQPQDRFPRVVEWEYRHLLIGT